MRALPESVGAARPIIRRHSSTTMMAACRGVYTASPETGYSKGAVSGNKRMTDISGDPDREIAVALWTETAVYPDLSKCLTATDEPARRFESKVAIFQSLSHVK